MGHTARSRSRERKKSSRDRSRSRDRGEHSGSVDKRSKNRDRSRSRDHKRRDRSRSRDRKRDRRHKSRSSERRHKDKRHRDRSRSRSRHRHHRRRSSSSREHSQPRDNRQNVKILSLEEVMQQKRRADESTSQYDLRQSFHIGDEFSQEGFEQFSLEHGIDLATIETEEERTTVHEKMEEILKAHFASQGKVYPPPKVEKPAVNAATGFANDGSFLAEFKKMQDDKKKQEEDEKKRKALELRLKTMPIRRRAGGKILKTGVVAKAKVVKPNEAAPSDSFASYMKEVEKYKKTSCDNDSKTRPLVK